MSSTNEFEVCLLENTPLLFESFICPWQMLIAGTARGLPTSTLRLVDFVGVHDCSEQQMERLLMALCIRLDRRHMSLPTAIRGSEHYKLPLVSLRCLGIVVAKDQSRTTPSLKLSERLTSLWPVIWGWIQLFHSFILNDNDFDLTFRLSAKSVVLSILHMFASYVSLLPVIQGTSGVVALLFELWSLEAKSHDFDPSNQRYKTTPAVLAMNSYFPESSECKLDWQNTSMSAVGGTAMDVASIALTHLRGDTRPARPDIVIVIMDLKMLGYLSFHVPIRNAILSQHSVLEVTKVAVSLSSQTASSHTRDTLVCLSSCFKYILWQLSFGDVWTWTIQSLDGQLLRAILSSEPYQSRLDDQRLLLDISDAITKNLSTRAVTLAAARAVKKVHAHGLEDRFLVAADEPLRQKWLALKELIHEREQLIPWDNDARKNPIKSCNNRKVSSSLYICSVGIDLSPLKQCRSVEETEGSFKRCGGCLSSFYCSSACQKEHWKREHRSYCLHVQSSRQGEGCFQSPSCDID